MLAGKGKAIPTHFSGCFGDVTINNLFQNFATSSNRPGASLASCPLNAKSRLGFSITGNLTDTETPIETTTSITLEGCSIGLNPVRDLEVDPLEGLRFGNGPDTRNEFNIPSHIASSLTNKSEFQIEFKTTGSEGVLLYVTGAKQIDFVAIFMQEGRLYYFWNNGGKTAMGRREQTVNDGNWHRVVVSRSEKTGSMSIDNEPEILMTSQGEESILNVKSPIFIGGLSDDISKGARNNLKVPNNLLSVTSSFPGCLRNLVVQGVAQDFSKDSIPFGSRPCSSKVESGVFFHSTSSMNNYVVIKDKFRVGERIKIDMRIRPRSKSGVLMSVSAKLDFLILQMVDGAIKFTVDNGGGPFSVTKEPGKQLCDGEWHTIQAVKERNIITLSLDDGTIAIAVGMGGISSTDTNDPLYLGGVPAGESTPGLDVTDKYVGCISDIKISDRPVFMGSSVVYGDVTLNTCPTT